MTTAPSDADAASELRYSDRYQDLDFAAIQAWLASTYWSPGISRALVERSFASSHLVMGAFVGAQQVGVARAVTDTVRFGYVADVFVDPGWRGRGIARAMVARLIGHLDAAPVTGWMLGTRDAHAVYRPLGFGPLAHPERWMERVGPT